MPRPRVAVTSLRGVPCLQAGSARRSAGRCAPEGARPAPRAATPAAHAGRRGAPPSQHAPAVRQPLWLARRAAGFESVPLCAGAAARRWAATASRAFKRAPAAAAPTSQRECAHLDGSPASSCGTPGSSIGVLVLLHSLRRSVHGRCALPGGVPLLFNYLSVRPCYCRRSGSTVATQTVEHSAKAPTRRCHPVNTQITTGRRGQFPMPWALPGFQLRC